MAVLYTTGAGGKRYGPDVIGAFLRAMARIDAALNEQDLRRQKGLRYEKLKGDRAGQHSVRLNDQWRLMLRPSKDEDGAFMWVIEIVDYH